VARKYVNPNRPVQPHVSEQMLTQARASAAAAAAVVREAELADPAQPGWDAGLAAAETAARAAAKRVEMLEAAAAAQLERVGQRDAAARAAAADLESIAAGLAASRDAVAAAAGAHLRALADLARAVDEHNIKLAEGRAHVAGLGLAVRDDLIGEDQEHAEGTLDRGVRAAGTDWTPIPAAGVVTHALRQVFGREGPLHPLAQVGQYTWRPFEVEARPDRLKVPGLDDVGAVLPPDPVRPVARPAPLSALGSMSAAEDAIGADGGRRRGKVA
jgi:hypothetical protein